MKYQTILLFIALCHFSNLSLGSDEDGWIAVEHGNHPNTMVPVPKPTERDESAIRTTLGNALEEFNELAVDLPFGRLYFGWQEKVREMYKDASRDLIEATKQVSYDPQEAVKRIRRAHGSYREVGLLMPFFEINKTKAGEIMSRYLLATDMLESAIVQLSNHKPVDPNPIPNALWRYDGNVWMILSHKMNFTDGVAQCRNIEKANTQSWHLPDLRELARSFRAMKDPNRNKAFGDVASKFTTVWTTDEKAPGMGHYFVDFQREDTGISADHVQHIVVCVADDKLN